MNRPRMRGPSSSPPQPTLPVFEHDEPETIIEFCLISILKRFLIVLDFFLIFLKFIIYLRMKQDELIEQVLNFSKPRMHVKNRSFRCFLL